MIIIGDELIKHETITKISSINEILNTSSLEVLIFEYNEDLMKYCFENNLNFGVIVSNLKDSIYANALKSKYIIANLDLAITIQKIAENYMFDSRVLVIIESNENIEAVALNHIDGVIYNNLIN